MSASAHFGDHRSSEERQLDDVVDKLHGMVEDFRHGIADATGRRWSLTATQLLERARQRSRDKNPPPERIRCGGLGHGDPVAGQGLAFSDKDEDLEHWRRFFAHLTSMAEAGRMAIREQAAATPLQQHPPKIEPNHCRVCGDQPIYRGKADLASERCEWCWRHWCLYGVDMPRRIVAWRKQGKRITDAMIKAEID